MLYNTEGRLPYLKPEDMNEKQKEFYDIHLKAFETMPYVWMTENKDELFEEEQSVGLSANWASGRR